MIRPTTLLLAISVSAVAAAQNGYSSIDALALKVPQASTGSTNGIIEFVKQNFTSDSARVRAIYTWVANNISYDVPRLRRLEADPKGGTPQPVEDVLKTRTAVCQGYSDLFVELCKGAGLNAVMVNGYTKNNGVIAPIGHAWAAVELEGKWWLFDPTWGAGYVRNDQFVKSFNNKYYKLQASELIRDHMPFDPMYQFLNYPITNKEFIESQALINVASSSRPYFNYSDSLKIHRQLSKQDQVISEVRRIESNGVRLDLIQRRLNILKLNMQSFASKDSFTEGVEAMKRATALFNEYIAYKNAQFGNIEDDRLKLMTDSMSHYVKHARTLMNSAVVRTDQQRQAMAANNRNLERFQLQLMKEKEFVDKYLVADRNGRLQLFGRR